MPTRHATDESTVAAATFTAFDRLLGQGGANAEAAMAAELPRLLDAYGVSAEAIGHARARIPVSLAHELLDLEEVVLRDPALGLHAAALYRHGDHELLDYVIESAPTLGECLQSGATYAALLNTTLRVTLVPQGDWTELRFESLPGRPRRRAVIEYSLATTVFAGHQFHGAKVSPPRIRLSQAKPPNAAQYGDLLGSEVEFGAPYDALVIPTMVLARPLPTGDSTLHAILCDVARERMQGLRGGRSVAGRVAECIENSMAQATSLKTIARKLGVSPATLRRRLEEEATTFKDLVEGVRREVSGRLLATSSLSVEEISERLGFAQSPAFHRAFRRWYGKTPVEYRRSLGRRPLVRLLDE